MNRWQTIEVTKTLTKEGRTWQPGQRGHISRVLPDKLTPTVRVDWHVGRGAVRQIFTERELLRKVRIILLDK